jgi:predicted AlkP superfamily phosphohydrolase/phosphomutase
MTNGQVLAIGLDGCELSYAQRLIAEGGLPSIAARFERSALVRLEHGAATRTGLAWEHFWSGRSPEAAGRPAAIEFDARTYTAWAEGARFVPFFDDHGIDTVVFDTPYADLSLTPATRGVVAWGSHDPGVSGLASNPTGLADELVAHVGAYPSPEWMYTSPWPSVDETRAMGRALVTGIEARGRAARWLFGERLRDWELGIAVTSELHSAAEAFWHGVDPTHPLHDHASAPAAAEALREVYEAIDRFVGQVVDATAAESTVLFAMGGMGANTSDVPSMVLLPELVSRWATGRRFLDVPTAWSAAPAVVPAATGGRSRFDRSWYPAMHGAPGSTGARVGLRGTARFVPAPIHRRVSRARSARRDRSRGTGYQSVEWQPASWYRQWWHEMRAFALPSFYDGRIRVNVRGREIDGVVEPTEYVATCDELEHVVRSCLNPWGGESVVAAVERPGDGDPFAVGSASADLVVVWAPGVFALEHPTLGLVGPVPYRRTGGHTGPFGFAAVSGPDIPTGDRGFASSFDVAPTLLELTGRSPDTGSGTSLLSRLRVTPAR